MTLPPLIRIFFAIDLPVSIKDKLGSFLDTLKKKAKTKGIRWSKPDHLHITLQFLAAIQSEDLPMLLSHVQTQIAGRMTKLTLSFGMLQVLPNPNRPRVIVLEIRPQDALVALAQSIGEGIKAAQYPVETRPFKAHLTLGRLKQPQGANVSWLAACVLPEFDSINVSEVVLFRSEPQADGSHYSVLTKVGL